MSLYYDAASIIAQAERQGSLKSRVYAKDAITKSKPAHVYALLSETAKYDVFLKEVIDNAGLLSQEPKLTPLLALLLTHDHFFAKGAIATAATHPLRQCIERHKARLQSEFTKARLKRRSPTIDQLKLELRKEKGTAGRLHPRWARVNTLKSNLDAQLRQDFTGYVCVEDIEDVIVAPKASKVLYIDKHIPNLLALPPEADLTKLQSYSAGKIILQDKASCFPAHLLLGDEPSSHIGGAMDGCAAPGNKTTHMAAILRHIGSESPAYACERDAARSKTLQSMVDIAGASDMINVLARQDFLALNPKEPRFRHITHLLLDPSCSGSGILGREDVPVFALPVDPRNPNSNKQLQPKTSKKRKRNDLPNTTERNGNAKAEGWDGDTGSDEQQPMAATKERLEKLSNLQSRIIEHAFSFPAARRITYSTCSIHVEENEAVVQRVLASKVGMNRGWRVLKRSEQVEGMQIWSHRGVGGGHGLTQEQRDACIRCTPDDGEGTMGFFVCGFVRDVSGDDMSTVDINVQHHSDRDGDWEGFSDT